MKTAKQTGWKAIQATDCIFLFIQPVQMASTHSCLASCAWWHTRRLFSSSGRHMEPSPLWPMQWCMALSVYSQLCAACDGWWWRKKSPGCAADIKICSRDAVEIWPRQPPISPLLHSYLTHSFPFPLRVSPCYSFVLCQHVSLLHPSLSSSPAPAAPLPSFSSLALLLWILAEVHFCSSSKQTYYWRAFFDCRLLLWLLNLHIILLINCLCSLTSQLFPINSHSPPL